ncbi:MAG: CPBP family intramembrane glutamic endopeptidase [Candidatus Hodarchaeales archaeon]|jgi:membrane protease YdiL (CAAX protease family)
MALMTFFLIFRVLGLPNGDETFSRYMYNIRILNNEGIVKNIIIGIACSLIFLLPGLFIIIIPSFTWSLESALKEILPPDSWLIFASLSSGIFEEIVFRGVILVVLLKKGFNKYQAIFLTSLLFGSAHLINLFMGRELSEVLFQMIGSFLLGLVLSYLFIQTNSLLPPIILHYSINAFWRLFLYIFVDATEYIFVTATWTLTPLITIPLFLKMIGRYSPFALNEYQTSEY